MAGRRLTALLVGVVLLLVAACGPVAAFIAWGAAKLDARDAGTQLRWLVITLAAGAALMVVGSLLLRYFLRSGRPVESGLVPDGETDVGHDE